MVALLFATIISVFCVVLCSKLADLLIPVYHRFYILFECPDIDVVDTNGDDVSLGQHSLGIFFGGGE